MDASFSFFLSSSDSTWVLVKCCHRQLYQLGPTDHQFWFDWSRRQVRLICIHIQIYLMHHHKCTCHSQFNPKFAVACTRKSNTYINNTRFSAPQSCTIESMTRVLPINVHSTHRIRWSWCLAVLWLSHWASNRIDHLDANQSNRFGLNMLFACRRVILDCRHRRRVCLNQCKNTTYARPFNGKKKNPSNGMNIETTNQFSYANYGRVHKFIDKLTCNSFACSPDE